MIRDIYNDLAETVVEVKGKPVRVFNFDELPNQISSDKLPCRLLIPYGIYPLEGIEWQFLSMGGNTLVGEWVVLDLFLYKAVASGDGLNEFSPVAVDYIDAYVGMIQSLKGGLTPMKQAHIKAFSPQTAIWEWGNQNYAGVMTLLRIEESRHG